MKPKNTTKIPDLCVSKVEWTKRADNVLTHLGIHSLQALSRVELRTLQCTRNAGIKTIREFASACVLNHFRPQFLGGLRYNIEAHAKDGYKRLTEAYGENERVMLDTAIAQLGSIPYCVVAQDGGMVLYRSPLGWKDAPEDKEDVK